MADRERSGRQAAGGQLVIPVAAILFTLYYATTIWSSPFEAQVAAIFVGTILVALSGLFIVQHIARNRSGEISLSMGDLIGRREMLPKRLGLFALTLGFMWFIEDLGFTLSTFLFLALAMFLLSEGRRPLLAIGVAAVASLAGYLLFILAFDTRFPRGWFEALIEGMRA